MKKFGRIFLGLALCMGLMVGMGNASANATPDKVDSVEAPATVLDNQTGLSLFSCAATRSSSPAPNNSSWTVNHSHAIAAESVNGHIIAFDCETSACSSSGEYTLQGVTVGLKLSPPIASRFRPYLKGGVTFNDLKGGYGAASTGLSTDRSPGFELGAGADYSFLGLLVIQPQLRYVGQNLKANIPGVTVTATKPESGVNYFTFDLGAALRLPFGM